MIVTSNSVVVTAQSSTALTDRKQNTVCRNVQRGDVISCYRAAPTCPSHRDSGVLLAALQHVCSQFLPLPFGLVLCIIHRRQQQQQQQQQQEEDVHHQQSYRYRVRRQDPLTFGLTRTCRRRFNCLQVIVGSDENVGRSL